MVEKTHDPELIKAYEEYSNEATYTYVTYFDVFQAGWEAGQSAFKNKMTSNADFMMALEIFCRMLMTRYGPLNDGSVVKLALHPKLYERVLHELIHDRSPALRNFHYSGELYVCGVQIVAREKETF